jgi:hypothetical protein
VQWHLFAEHLYIDAEDKIAQSRDIAEYAMAFHNPSGVNEVRKQREIEKTLEDEQSTDIFTQQVEKMFGRPLAKEQIKTAREKHTDDMSSPPIKEKPQVDKDIIKVSKNTKQKREQKSK